LTGCLQHKYIWLNKFPIFVSLCSTQGTRADSGHWSVISCANTLLLLVLITCGRQSDELKLFNIDEEDFA